MRYLITMDKKDIVFFCSILEVAERYGIVRTIDKTKPILEVIVSPYYQNEIKDLFEFMRKSISFTILEELDD